MGLTTDMANAAIIYLEKSNYSFEAIQLIHKTASQIDEPSRSKFYHLIGFGPQNYLSAIEAHEREALAKRE